MIYIWLGGIILFAIIEGLTMNLTSIWFAVGSFAGMVAAGFGAPLYVQLILFVALSAVTVIYARPLARKYLHVKKVRTNADMIIGKTGVVTQRISPADATGQARIGSQIWTARAQDGETIEAGAEVEVLRIEGVKAIVRLTDPVDSETAASVKE